MMPIGPAPVISTSSPSTSNDSAVWTALPKDRRSPARRGGIDVLRSSCTQTLVMRQRQILGERAGAIDADALGVLAEMPPAGQAVAAAAADDVPFAADDLAEVKILHVGADLDDLADELVADDHRHGDRSSAPRRPSCRYARRCRRCRCAAP